MQYLVNQRGFEEVYDNLNHNCFLYYTAMGSSLQTVTGWRGASQQSALSCRFHNVGRALPATRSDGGVE